MRMVFESVPTLGSSNCSNLLPTSASLSGVLVPELLGKGTDSGWLSPQMPTWPRGTNLKIPTASQPQVVRRGFM